MISNLESVEIVFDTINNFRLRAPKSVAQGMVILADGDFNNIDLTRKNQVYMMDLIANNTPLVTESKNVKGRSVETTKLAYNPVYTEAMLKDIDAEYKQLVVEKAHELRLIKVNDFLNNFKPTLHLGEALYRVSFYLISNEANLAKSTNLTISFVKKILLNQANNLLVDSALLLGGQGKSTIQKGLLKAAEIIGFNSSMCRLPSLRGGTSEIFLNNEICVDDENNFKDIDLDSLNKLLDKSNIIIKGKYIKEWSAKSISNILVGTNSLPTDVNARRYSVRMVDETFKLIENFGRCEIPGRFGDQYGNSYEEVVDWVTDGWLNLFYYCNKYDLPVLEYTNKSFDYNLRYRITNAIRDMGPPNYDINSLIKLIETREELNFDFKLKHQLMDQLYMLANSLDLPKVVENKSYFSVYDWSSVTIQNNDNDRNSLEFTLGFFNNRERFPILEEIDV